MSDLPGSKRPSDAASAAQAWLERSIRKPIGSEPPSPRRRSTGPPRTLTPPSFPAVAVAPIPAAPVPDLGASLAQGVPVQLLGADDARSLPMDHREAFVLSLVDGMTAVETLVDVSGMPREQVLSILQRLLDVGAIAME
jgi:hypothetical protein